MVNFSNNPQRYDYERKPLLEVSQDSTHEQIDKLLRKDAFRNKLSYLTNEKLERDTYNCAYQFILKIRDYGLDLLSSIATISPEHQSLEKKIEYLVQTSLPASQQTNEKKIKSITDYILYNTSNIHEEIVHLNDEETLRTQNEQIDPFAHLRTLTLRSIKALKANYDYGFIKTNVFSNLHEGKSYKQAQNIINQTSHLELLDEVEKPLSDYINSDNKSLDDLKKIFSQIPPSKKEYLRSFFELLNTVTQLPNAEQNTSTKLAKLFSQKLFSIPENKSDFIKKLIEHPEWLN